MSDSLPQRRFEDTATGPARRKPVLRLASQHEQYTMLNHVVEGPRGWTRETVSPQQWKVKLPGPVLDEARSLICYLRSAPLPVLLLHPLQFKMTACRDLIHQVQQNLTEGIGLSLLDRFPMEDMSDQEAVALFWVLGLLLSRPVATKWDGTMLYHVTDTGRRFGPGVRGSATNVELSFHTDNAFGAAVPDYVGLLCINMALTGGVSRFCSLYSVHNDLLRHQPWLLRRLYQPCYYDRQGEHAPGAPEVLSSPLFQYDGKRLCARLTPGLIRRGYEMAGEPMDGLLVEALEYLEGILKREDLWIEFLMERGQIQFVNNLWCAHYRSAFTDGPVASPQRHLIRVWYREHGAQTYDG
jgi:hypothetical protein